MKFALLLCMLLAGMTACAKTKKSTQLRTDEEYLRLAQPGPAAGRAEFVSPVALIPDPAKHNGKRVIPSGVWTEGFEHSLLDLENKAQEFWIWVDADWGKIDEQMGDFSRRKANEDKSRPNQTGRISHHIVAEGTFYFRKADLKSGISGFGHMGVSDGYFLVDRLFEFEPIERN